MGTETNTPSANQDHSIMDELINAPETVPQGHNQDEPENIVDEPEEEEEEQETPETPESPEEEPEEEEDPENQEEEEEDEPEEEEDHENPEEEEEEPEEEEEETETTDELVIPAWNERLREAFPDREFNTNEDYQTATGELIESLDTQLKAENEANDLLVSSWKENPRILKINQLMLQGYPEDVAVVMAGFSSESLAELNLDDLEDKTVREKLVEMKIQNKAAKEKQAKEASQRQKNQEKSEKEITAFQTSKKLPDSRMKDFNTKVTGLIDRILNLDFDSAMIEMLYNGFYADEITKKAEEKGQIRGRNEKIKVDKSKRKGDGLPKLNANTSQPKPKDPKYADPFDEALDFALRDA